MTVSPTHSVNLTGLNKAMTALALVGGPQRAPQPCLLYFAVPPDIYPMYQHKPGSMVPAGSDIPDNVGLIVLEIPLPEPVVRAAAASTSAASSASTMEKRKRKAEEADSLVPPSKKVVDNKCDCFTGCSSGHCKCFKTGNKCGTRCHTAANPSSAAPCSNK